VKHNLTQAATILSVGVTEPYHSKNLYDFAALSLCSFEGKKSIFAIVFKPNKP